MSINACTINNTTIDAICSNRRAAIISDLQSRLAHDEAKGHVQVNPIPRPQHTQQYRPSETEPQLNVLPMEQSQIAVTIEMYGEQFTQSMERGDDNFIPMINVYDIRSKTDTIESVNITDLNIRVLE